MVLLSRSPFDVTVSLAMGSRDANVIIVKQTSDASANWPQYPHSDSILSPRTEKLEILKTVARYIKLGKKTEDIKCKYFGTVIGKL